MEFAVTIWVRQEARGHNR